MDRVRIVTDSAADLPAEWADRLQITIVPLIVRFGDTVYQDGELPIDEFWRRTSQDLEHPATSQPSVGAFEKAFERSVAAGDSVLCVTLTGGHSGTHDSACMAARRFGDRVRVFDSQSLSLGQGFQAVAAAEAALAGANLAETVSVAEQTRACTQVFILLDTVEYLRRGGRAALLLPVLNRVSKMLRIKPVLHLVEGKLSLRSLVRSYGRGLTELVREVCEPGPVKYLAVVHTRSPDVARKTAERLSERLSYPRQDVLVIETGPLLSTHAGPGVIGIGVVWHGRKVF
jgi:DegV family protein with EDD domain